MQTQSTAVVRQNDIVRPENEVFPGALNVYIDTCSLIHLIERDSGLLLIANLEFWISNGRINFFTHDLIVNEWDTHKERFREHFRNNQRTKYNHAREVNKKENIIVLKDLQPNTEAYDRQIARIDTILTNATKLISSTQVKAISAERNIPPRRPPYHNKIDSVKDAFIIFSALEYFHRNGQEFLFISDNKDEFGDPENISRKIHHDLLTDYPGVQVKYYQDIGWAINELRRRIDISMEVEAESVREEPALPEMILLDRSKHLLEQLSQYLEIMHEDIAYVPPRILINNYPFRVGNENSIHYALFTAETSNVKLIELLKQFELSSEGTLPSSLQERFPEVSGAEEKCKTVLRYLTRDLIFNVTNRRGGKSVATRYVEGEPCHCAVCEFRRFNFVESFNRFSDTPQDEKDYLRLAYANYQVGNYYQAAKILQDALVFARARNQQTTSFIIQHNLSKLSIFLINYYYKDKEIETLGKELMKIKPSEFFESYATPQNIELLNYISEETFYTRSKDRIFELHYKIIDGYHEILRGRFVAHSFVWSLKNELAEIDSFLTKNRIVFDRFSNFSVLTDRIFEAMIASHGVRESTGSRLDSFDDWTLQRMMLYGNADNFNKYFARYNLKHLSCEYDEDSGFWGLLQNFFRSQVNLPDIVKAYCGEHDHSFWSYYNKVFCNALALFSKAEMPSSVAISVSEKIVDYLFSEDVIDELSLKNVRLLIMRRQKEWSDQLLIKMFWISIRKKYSNEHCTEATCEALIDRNLKLDLTDVEFAAIKDRFIKTESNGKVSRLSIEIFHIYRVLGEMKRIDHLKEIITKHIENEFDFQIYYYAVMWDIVAYSENYFNKILVDVLPGEGRKKIKGYIFGQRGDRYNSVNDFLNMVFKLDLDTTADRFEPIRELGTYYEWLLNMENFDYTKFDPYWLSEYKTRYYFRRIAGTLKVREEMESKLQAESIIDLEKQYYSVFIRRAWEIAK